jgi:hypothetical protein
LREPSNKLLPENQTKLALFTPAPPLPLSESTDQNKIIKKTHNSLAAVPICAPIYFATSKINFERQCYFASFSKATQIETE